MPSRRPGHASVAARWLRRAFYGWLAVEGTAALFTLGIVGAGLAAVLAGWWGNSLMVRWVHPTLPLVGPVWFAVGPSLFLLAFFMALPPLLWLAHVGSRTFRPARPPVSQMLAAVPMARDPRQVDPTGYIPPRRG